VIPISKPFLNEKEAAAAGEAVLSGWVSQGPKVKEFEEAFADYVGTKYACAVSNCTTALHVALLAVGVQPGDIVVTVSHSFISTANCIRFCGAEPIFVDIDPDTFNLSPDCLEAMFRKDCQVKGGRLIYGRDRVKRPVAAIVVVHQMGMPCDLKKILDLAKRYRLPVVEDAACAIGSEISFDKGKRWEKIGRPRGDIACFSFHPRKVITTGEGGMLTTHRRDYDKKFRSLRHQGMSVSDLVRHQARKVIFEEYPKLGYNYRMTDIQAAIGLEQLKKLPEIIARRREIAAFYHQELSSLAWLKIPFEPGDRRTNWQSYPLRVLDHAPLSRDALMQYLLDKGIATRRGIMNAHQEKIYASRKWHLPQSELARDSVILLPLFCQMKEEDCHYCVEQIKAVK